MQGILFEGKFLLQMRLTAIFYGLESFLKIVTFLVTFPDIFHVYKRGSSCQYSQIYIFFSGLSNVNKSSAKTLHHLVYKHTHTNYEITKMILLQ